jgi:hypothetical protein
MEGNGIGTERDTWYEIEPFSKGFYFMEGMNKKRGSIKRAQYRVICNE